uniref:Inositol-1-phosphate synthase n=1 Tax=uncultured bacterium esnapd4 TaxID=1366610 RepID=S5UAR4_9BACT|nr:inositol-1-phosphate synthase [uncultured bacterium esnapd4]QEO75005.1 omn30 [uncultured bacterium]
MTTGVWLIGARGSLATTVACGLPALRRGLVPPTGCVTAALALGEVFPDWDDLVLGGHDIVATPLEKRAEQLVGDGVVPQHVFAAVRPELADVERALRPGYDPLTWPGSQADAVARLAADIEEFRAGHGLDRVVVVNVSSTEAPVAPRPEHADLTALDRALADPRDLVLPPSSVAAYAAVRAGCGYVDFTPSTGIRLPALTELARRAGLPFAGSDGKTGQTLVRSVLAPMFAARGLRVHSWAGTNLLGGGDGASLAAPDRAAAKLASKAGVLAADIDAPLHIDNVPSLGERKIAWDHVAFEGFLGARMSLQFTWDGYDSALAAPLVLDLARLVAGAHAVGETGPLSQLGFFFKDPLDSAEHNLFAQARALAEWAEELGGGEGPC